MSDISTTLSFPGQVDVIKAEIISHSGISIDITRLILDLTLYEDIYANTMSGYILVEDALDLIGSTPLLGQEIFNVTLQTPTFKEQIVKQFYIYKLSARTLKVRSQAYILHFCSLELISSINSKVAKSFVGNISDIVTDIFRDDRYLSSQKRLEVDKTANEINFIAPYWTPLQTINWLTEKSVNKNGVSNYLFFESNKSYEFTSVDILLKGPSVMEYVFADVNAKTVSPDDFGKQFGIVESIETDVVFDYMRDTSAGMYGSTLYTFDLTTKSTDKTTYDYFDEFDKSTHLEKYPLRTKALPHKNLASVHHLTKNNFRNTNSKPLRYREFFLQRNSLIQQLSSFKFNIKVFGRTDIKVGNVITFTINETRQLVREDINESQSNYFSGRYLVSAIRHQIIGGKHFMNMEIVSDSFIKKIL